jgi:hypothetical protein
VFFVFFFFFYWRRRGGGPRPGVSPTRCPGPPEIDGAGPVQDLRLRSAKRQTRTAPRYLIWAVPRGICPVHPGGQEWHTLDLRKSAILRGSRCAGRRIALRCAAAVLGHLRVRRIDS